LNKLQSLRELRSEYDGTFNHTPGRPFVILCCSPGVDVRPFVAEFFHEVNSNPQPQNLENNQPETPYTLHPTPCTLHEPQTPKPRKNQPESRNPFFY